MLTRRTLLGAGTALLALPSLARAQSDWPARPVRVIVPFPPGGSVDIIARVLQPRLQEALGRPIVVENRGGAAGSVGAGEAARAAPDGYTWLLAYDTQATNESVMRLPFNTLEAFAPISLLASGPLALVAHRDAPWQTLQALIADAKARPDAISYATSGVGGLAHVATTLLGQQGGFRMTHVPYRGAGPAVQDVLAGHVPLFMSNVVVIKEHMASGALRPLGVSTAAESPHVPGVRSFAQQGFPGFQAPTWWMLMTQARVPAPIQARMQQAITQVLAEPAIRQQLGAQGADVIGSSSAQADAFLRSEIAKWAKVIRDNDIRADS
jgi:tripartite-type tricarboxylate transporter receptor subunit TctC